MGNLCELLPYVDIHDTTLQVRDVFHEGQWLFDRMFTQLPMDIQLILCSVVISEDTEDALIWGASTSGLYSSKSGYQWLVQSTPTHDYDHSWSWIWKLKLPKNLQHFLWQAAHCSLPCNSLRVQRHVSQDALCQKCGAPQETLFHTLRDCPTISLMWDRLGFTNFPGFFGTDFREWLKTFALHLRGTILVVICWSI